nr:hypothetical protein Q903MT_gene6297 [Picea sitchensis]
MLNNRRHPPIVYSLILYSGVPEGQAPFFLDYSLPFIENSSLDCFGSIPLGSGTFHWTG